MDKAEILQVINECSEWYQKIQLPFDLETPGRDRSQIANQILPTDFEGASVLDIGCAEGFFCFEAKKRNAGRVVGIEPNGERLDTAIRLSSFLSMDIEFLQQSIEDIEELGTFDYVLCLNVLYHVKDPICVIHKLVHTTRGKLILETADLRAKFSDITGHRWWRPLFKLSSFLLRPPVLMIDSRGKFLITRKWMEHFLLNQFPNIERIEFLNSDRPNRYLVVVSCF